MEDTTVEVTTTEGPGDAADALALLEGALGEDGSVRTPAGPPARPASAPRHQPSHPPVADEPAARLRVRKGEGLRTYRRACDRRLSRPPASGPLLEVRRRALVAPPGPTGVPPLLAQGRRAAGHGRAEMLPGVVALAFLVGGLVRARSRVR